MGQGQTWYVYGRSYDQHWLPDPIVSTLCKADDVQHHVGRFKHMVYKLCLGHLENVHKIYLYQGWRMAKAERHATYVKITLRNQTVADAWDKCVEVPTEGRCLEQDFLSHHVPEEEHAKLSRRFRPRDPHHWTI